MSTSSPSKLEDALRMAGEGWLIDSFSPPERAIPHILSTLESVQQEGRRRLGADAPTISEEVLLREFQRNPRRVGAFFQALALTANPEMLLMAWRIIQGMEVKQISLDYQRQQSFKVRVVLESPYGEEEKPYESQSILDFALFRHLGILEISGRPVFHGFYDFRTNK